MAYANPFAPHSAAWNGHPAGPYGDYTLHPRYEPQTAWPGATNYVPANPGPFAGVPQAPYPHANPRTQYYDGYMPAQHPLNPPHVSEAAPPPRPRRRRAPPTTGILPAERDLEHIQRRLQAVELENRQEKILRQARRERDRAERQQREMGAKVDRLRKDIERSFKADIRDAVDDIRREIQLSQSESQSEPGRAPSLMGGSRRGGRAAPARSVHGDRGVDWEQRDAGEEEDVLMREIGQFIEGKRRLQPQGSSSGAAVFGTGAWAGPGSAQGPRIDPELRSELETIVFDVLGESEVVRRHHRRSASRPGHGRAASEGYNAHAATQVDPRDRHRQAYDGGDANLAAENPFAPQRSPSRVRFEQNDSARPRAALRRPTDERDWVGTVPNSRRPRPRRGDTGEPTAPTMQSAGLTQQPPPPRANQPINRLGTDAQDAGSWGAGGSSAAIARARARAYRDSTSRDGAQQGVPGDPGRPLYRRDDYSQAATYGDEDAGEAFTDDESDDLEVFRKRDASYPEYPAGHPDLRYRAQVPRAPEPGPYLRRAGI